MKRFLMKGLAILIACLLVVCGFQSPIPRFGPGLTDAAAAAIDLGTLTPTDIVPIEPPAELMATTVPQVKNILVTVTVTRSDLNQANSTIRFRDDRASFDLDLHKYDLGDLPNISSPVWIDWEDNREMELYVLSSHNFAANTTILRACFNAPSTATITHASLFEGSSPLIQCITSGALSDANTNADNALAYQVAFLGDVDMNGTIDAVDNLKTLQFAAGTITLTADQQLAADVTLDGSVNAVDAMKISQYSVQTLASFWDHGRFNIPAANVEGVGDNNVFRLKNVSDSKYLTTADIRSLPVYLSTTYNPKQTIAKFKFERVSGAGCYRIRHMASGALLQLDNDYKTTLSTTDVKDESHHWYVVPVTGGFQIVNKTYTGRALTNAFPTDDQTTNCCADYFDRGNVWKLEGPKIKLSYHYDEGYETRYPGAGQNVIDDYQRQIALILENVFMAEVTLYPPSSDPTESFADLCGNGINANCSDTSATATSCAANCKVHPYTNGVHHKNANSLLLQWYNQIPTAQRDRIHVMYSGHFQCYSDNNNVHTVNSLNGLTYSTRRVAVVYSNGGSTREYVEKLTALHEISHDLGASAGNNVAVDSNHSTAAADINCIMSYSRNNATLATRFEKDAQNDDMVASHQALYCTSCRTAIKNYLAENF